MNSAEKIWQSKHQTRKNDVGRVQKRSRFVKLMLSRSACVHFPKIYKTFLGWSFDFSVASDFPCNLLKCSWIIHLFKKKFNCFLMFSLDFAFVSFSVYLTNFRNFFLFLFHWTQWDINRLLKLWKFSGRKITKGPVLNWIFVYFVTRTLSSFLQQDLRKISKTAQLDTQKMYFSTKGDRSRAVCWKPLAQDRFKRRCLADQSFVRSFMAGWMYVLGLNLN